MNLFVTDPDPVVAARNQCDKLLVKMILETAQMLSTAHRILDGTLASGKRKAWVHPSLDSVLYKATHYNHPSSVWLRTTADNYEWGYKHFSAMCDEYTYRFGKTHKTDSVLRSVLKHPPTALKRSTQTAFVKCMGASPESLAIAEPVAAYRHFYQTKQNRFKMVWTKRPVPSWFKHN